MGLGDGELSLPRQDEAEVVARVRVVRADFGRSREFRLGFGVPPDASQRDSAKMAILEFIDCSWPGTFVFREGLQDFPMLVEVGERLRSRHTGDIVVGIQFHDSLVVACRGWKILGPSVGCREVEMRAR